MVNKFLFCRKSLTFKVLVNKLNIVESVRALKQRFTV